MKKDENDAAEKAEAIRNNEFEALTQARDLEIRADVLFDKGMHAAALPLFIDAVLKRKIFGAKNPSILKPLQQIVALYLEQGRLEEAEAALNEALAIVDSNFHTAHAKMAPILELRAELLIAQGRPADALPMLERAGEIYLNTATMENRATLRTYYKLATLYMQLDKPEDAKKIIEKAMKYVDTPLGPVAEFRFQMALAQVMAKNTYDAKQSFMDASEGFRQRANYLKVVDCLQRYAKICRESGEYIQAETALKEADRYKTLEHFYPEDIFVATLLRA